MAICGHRDFDAFAILHAEFPQHILEVFLLRYEYAIALLTNLKTYEEFQFSHHRHLIFLTHHIGKFVTVMLVSTAKDNIIIVFVKRVGSSEPGLKPFFMRYSFKVSYHARGASLRP